MDFDFSRAVRISLEYRQITGLRGHPSPFVSVYRHATDMDYYAAYFLAVHGLTHLDLPHADALTPSVAANLSPQIRRAVVLDFIGKQKVLEPVLVRDSTDPLDAQTCLLDMKVVKDGEFLWLLIQQLAIRVDDLEEVWKGIPADEDLSDWFVLFRTDWIFRFNRYGNSYNNPALEGWAAFLCHPYIDPEALNWLAERGITALGHDLPSFENPLYYAIGGDVHPVVRQARQIAMERTPHFEQKVFQSLWLRQADAEEGGQRCYLKNLNLHPLAEAMEKPKRRVIAGRLAVVPVPVLQDREGVACEVFFAPDEA